MRACRLLRRGSAPAFPWCQAGAPVHETPNGILATAREVGLPSTRFRQVGPTRFAAVLDRILETFTRGGIANRDSLWLWDDLQEPCHALIRPDVCRVIRPASTPVWFMTEDHGRTKRHSNYWLFEGDLGAVVDVIENHYHMEYYVVSRKLDWMLLENHHDVLYGVGEWIVARLHAIEATSSNP